MSIYAALADWHGRGSTYRNILVQFALLIASLVLSMAFTFYAGISFQNPVVVNGLALYGTLLTAYLILITILTPGQAYLFVVVRIERWLIRTGRTEEGSFIELNEYKKRKRRTP